MTRYHGFQELEKCTERGHKIYRRRNNYGIVIKRERDDKHNIAVSFNNSMMFSRRELTDFYETALNFFEEEKE
jgi:hypothetical protein